MAPSVGGIEEGSDPQGRLWTSPTPFFLYIFSVLINLSFGKDLDRLQLFFFKLQTCVWTLILGLIKSLRSLSLEPLAKMTFDAAALPPWKSITGQSSEKSCFFVFVVYSYLVGNHVWAQCEDRCYADQPGLGSHPGSTYHMGESKLFNCQA